MIVGKSKAHQSQFNFCYNQKSFKSLIMLEAPHRIPRLIYYTPQATMFIWITHHNHNDLKSKIPNSVSVFITMKRNIREVAQQFDQHRTTSNVVIICQPCDYQQVLSLKQQNKELKKIICFTKDDNAPPDQDYELLICGDELELIGYIKQMKNLTPSAKILPNFLFLTTLNKMSEVVSSLNISNILYVMLNQSIDQVTTNCLVDELEKIVGILQQQILQYKIKSLKSKQFFFQLRKGLNIQEALKWYTDDSIVNKLVNNLLRSGIHSTQIFYIQPYFKTLFNSILYIYNQERSKNTKSSFKCYRGGYITQEELQKFRDNKNKLVQNLGFLSTSLDRKIAEDFSSNVLFEIEVPPQSTEGTEGLYDCGYAEVSKYSKFFVEAEILFNPLNIFKILATQRGLDKWIVKIEHKIIQKSPTEEKNNQVIVQDEKIEEIIKLSFQQKNKIKVQGDCFSKNNDLYGFEQYWTKHLQILSKQVPIRKASQIQALLKLAHYYNFIGSVKQPLRVLQEVCERLFSFSLENYFRAPPDIENKVGLMCQKEYQMYTLMIKQLSSFYAKIGLYSKSLSVLQAFLSLSKKLHKSQKSKIIASQLCLIHFATDFLSEAPRIYERYIQNQLNQDQLLTTSRIQGMRPAAQILKGGIRNIQEAFLKYKKLLQTKEEVFGFNDYSYSLIMNEIQYFLKKNIHRLDPKAKKTFVNSIKAASQYTEGIEAIKTKSVIMRHSAFKLQQRVQIQMNKLQSISKLKDHLLLCSSRFGIFNFYFLQSLRMLSQLYGSIGKINKQIELLITSTRLFQHYGQTKNIQYWRQLRQLTKSFVYVENFQMAYKTIKKSVQFQNISNQSCSLFYSETLYYLGTVLYRLGRNSESTNSFKDGQRIYQFLFKGKEACADYIQLSIRFATVYIQNQCFGEAMSLSQRSWELSKQSLPNDHPMCLKAFHLLGQINKYQKQFGKASKIFQQCLRISQKMQDSNLQYYILTIMQLSQSYMLMEKYRLALNLIRKCIYMQSKHKYFEKHYNFFSFNLQFYLFESTKHYREAHKSQLECLKLQFRLYKNKCYPSIESISKILVVRQKSGNLDSSTQIFKQILKYIQKIGRLSKLQKQSLLSALNNFEHRQSFENNCKQSIKEFEKVIQQLRLSKPSPLRLQLIQLYSNKLSFFYQQLGCLQKSLEVIAKCPESSFNINYGVYQELQIKECIQFYKRSNSLHSFLEQNKIRLVAKAKLRFLFIKNISECKIKIHSYFSYSPDFQFEFLTNKLKWLRQLRRAMKKMLKKLIKKFYNISQICKLQDKQSKKKWKKLKANIKMSKKHFRKCQFMSFIS